VKRGVEWPSKSFRIYTIGGKFFERGLFPNSPSKSYDSEFYTSLHFVKYQTPSKSQPKPLKKLPRKVPVGRNDSPMSSAPGILKPTLPIINEQ
jgi:hypothetical protein